MLRILLAIALAAAALYLWNASWLAGPAADAQLRLIAHRGVHQTFGRENLTNQTCTAERVHPPEHDLLENTIPSMRAAFEAGSDVVEIDVHPTTDGRFAVFHDWTLDCRTDGEGVTREHAMDELEALDIGHGYTADGGETFPFRGTAVGMMPSLDEVMSAFPEGRFLINFKGGEAREGEMLADAIEANPGWRERTWSVYGAPGPVRSANARIDNLHGFDTRQTKRCLIRYLALGWSGHVPEACHDTHVMVPGNYAWLLWGWPHRLRARLDAAGSDIILIGPYSRGDPGTSGIDTLDELRFVPDGFDGYLWTNRIEVIGPVVAGVDE